MSTVQQLTADELAIGISKAYEEYIEKAERRDQASTRNNVYASSWRLCTRQMVLEMLKPQSLRPFSTNTLANFRRGKDRERDLLADLTRAGRNCDPQFEVIGREERFELKDRKGRTVITGKVDARIQSGRRKAPLEVKSWNANMVAQVRQFSDLFENRWTRAGAHQLLSYMYASDEPIGFLLLDRNGLPVLLPVILEEHLTRMEDFLHRAEIAMDAKEAIQKKPEDIETLLPAYTDKPAECRVCGFFGSECTPATSFAGASVIVDEEVLLMIQEHAELKDAQKRYNNLHDKVADVLKSLVKKGDEKQIIAGMHVIEVWWEKQTGVKGLPDDLKKKYTVSDPTGKMRFEIEKPGVVEAE